MACEKYSNSIVDATLGALNAKYEAELHDHLAQCNACRNAFDHAKAVSIAVSRGVEALVAGEPSPQFATRLRARIANEPVPAHPKWRAWIPAMAGALALAALLMAVMIRTPRQASRDIAPVAQIPPKPEIVVPANPENGIVKARETLVPAKYHRAHGQEPEVLVPPGQLAAVMQFANAVNAGRIDGEQIVAAQKQSEKPIETEAIQILPLNIPEIDSSGPAGSPGGF